MKLRLSSVLTCHAATLLLCMCCILIQSPPARAQDSDVLRLREEQEKFACDLRYNDTLYTNFYLSTVANDPDESLEDLLVIAPVGLDKNVRCKAVEACPNAPVTWCVYLYHPVEDIKLCYDNFGNVTDITDAAARLRLQDKYQIVPEVCSSNFPGCLKLSSVEHFMSFSRLTCTAHNQTCRKQTDYKLDVAGSGETAGKPKLELDRKTELCLNDTNIFLCSSSVPADPYPIQFSSRWMIDDVPINNMLNYNPYCGIDSSLEDRECPIDYSSIEKSRVRVHSYLYSVDACPHPIVVMKAWLVIENATAEDAEKTYKCHSSQLVLNPTFTYLTSEEVFNVQPLYPLVEVVTSEQTSMAKNLSYHLKSNSSFQWSCSVQAGVQDRLVWLHEGKEILDIDPDVVDGTNHTNVTEGVYNSNSIEDVNCSSNRSITDAFVVSETERVGLFHSQFTTTLFICEVTDKTPGFYECVLRRRRGEDVRIRSATLQWPEDPDTPSSRGALHQVIISVVVVTSIIAIVLVVTVIGLFVWHRRSSKRHAVWELAMGAISVTDDILLEGFERNNSLRKKNSLRPSLIEGSDPLEFPRNKLILLDRILGEGTFGVVRQARAEGIVESTPERNIVAVKTTKPNAPPHEISSFWEELQLMKNMVPHGNLVNLLGYCTTGGPLYMIIEYANHGSLKDFLKSCEDAVKKLNHVPQVKPFRTRQTSSTSTGCPQRMFKLPVSAQNSVFSTAGTPTTVMTAANSNGKFDFSSAPAIPTSLNRERLITQDSGFFGESGSQATFNDILVSTPTSTVAHTIAPLSHDYVNSKGLLYMEDLQNFALQIACGLKHLEDIDIVHCDLAARNILIAEGFVLKIGDFGMARDVSEKEYYRKQGGRVPVKWTAPEALKDQIFTYKSDIWSFGVILWEIFTYGQQPYPKFKIRHSWEPFIAYLMEGNRLPQPKGCPDNFYDLMKSCWGISPDQRPTAEKLVQLFSRTNLLYEEDDSASKSDSITREEDAQPSSISGFETQV